MKMRRRAKTGAERRQIGTDAGAALNLRVKTSTGGGEGVICRSAGISQMSSPQRFVNKTPLKMTLAPETCSQNTKARLKLHLLWLTRFNKRCAVFLKGMNASYACARKQLKPYRELEGASLVVSN